MCTLHRYDPFEYAHIYSRASTLQFAELVIVEIEAEETVVGMAVAKVLIR